jgi:hypothetical protein
MDFTPEVKGRISRGRIAWSNVCFGKLPLMDLREVKMEAELS